ncbi:MAG: DMT family transporter [bacterium]
MPSSSKAVILGIVASLLWSTVFVAGRYLCDVLNIHPTLVAFLRFFGAGIISLIYLMIKGKAKSLSVLKNSPGLIILLAITGISVMGSAVFLALNLSTAVDVSIIMNSNTIFIVPLAALTGERITLRKVGGIIIGLFGCALVINGKITGFQLIHSEYLTGNLLALVASISWAIYTVMGKNIVRERGGLTITSLNMMIGSIPLLAITAGLGELSLPPLRAIIILAYLAIFPTAIGFVFWYKALENIDASRLGPLQYIVPVGTAIISAFTLNEEIKVASVLGMVMVFLGIYLSSLQEKSS